MKAYELMIGDLIAQGRVSAMCDNNVFVEGRVGCIYGETLKDEYASPNVAKDRIEPIPITEEILKANDGLCENFFYDGERLTICSDNITIIGIFTYVHELQHALRLCGLNDLADNFEIKTKDK